MASMEHEVTMLKGKVCDANGQLANADQQLADAAAELAASRMELATAQQAASAALAQAPISQHAQIHAFGQQSVSNPSAVGQHQSTVNQESNASVAICMCMFNAGEGARNAEG